MRTYKRRRVRDEAILLLEATGWTLRAQQTGGDYEDFVHDNHDQDLLLVDFALGRFIVSAQGFVCLTQNSSEGDSQDWYNEILDSLYDNGVPL